MCISDFPDFQLTSPSPEQWAQWRLIFGDYPALLQSMTTIDDCDGDLEDAALTLALQARLEPDGNLGWLGHFAKRYRPILCEALQGLNADDTRDPVVLGARHLLSESDCPEGLVFPVVLWAMAQGIQPFCQPLG